MKIEWTDEALEASLIALNKKHYAQMSKKEKKKAMKEMRYILDEAIEVQGINRRLEMYDRVRKNDEIFIDKTWSHLDDLIYNRGIEAAAQMAFDNWHGKPADEIAAAIRELKK